MLFTKPMVTLLQKGGVTVENSQLITFWIFLGLVAVIFISQIPKLFHHKDTK